VHFGQPCPCVVGTPHLPPCVCAYITCPDLLPSLFHLGSWINNQSQWTSVCFSLRTFITEQNCERTQKRLMQKRQASRRFSIDVLDTRYSSYLVSCGGTLASVSNDHNRNDDSNEHDQADEAVLERVRGPQISKAVLVLPLTTGKSCPCGLGTLDSPSMRRWQVSGSPSSSQGL
jgi:hypothetical protein